jgi:hypothetical protein
MRSAAKVAGRVAAVVLLVAAGTMAGVFYADHRDPIEPVRVSQFYGESAGMNERGQYCIESESDGRRCAIPRLRDGAEVPPTGSPVRGGFGRIPSDTSDLPEPSWLWLTRLACPDEPADATATCP